MEHPLEASRVTDSWELYIQDRQIPLTLQAFHRETNLEEQ